MKLQDEIAGQYIDSQANISIGDIKNCIGDMGLRLEDKYI